MTELLMLKVPLGAQESGLHLTSQTGLLVQFSRQISGVACSGGELGL